jgi:hypothetical protein
MSHGRLATSALGKTQLTQGQGANLFSFFPHRYIPAASSAISSSRPSIPFNIWLTFAAFRIFSHAASHPHDATVLCLTL